MTFWTNIFCACVDTSVSYCTSLSSLTRKHGQWRNRSVFPKSFAVISMMALTASQVSSFTTFGLHRFPYLSSVQKYHGRPSIRKVPFRDWVPFYNGTWGLSNDVENFFHQDLLDYVYHGMLTEDSVASSTSSSPHLLHAEGSFMAESWLEEMARVSKHTLPYSTIDNDDESVPSLQDRCDNDTDSLTDALSDSDLDDDSLLESPVLSFKSIPTISVRTPLSELPDEVVQALLELPLEPAELYVAAHHQVDLSHFL